MTALPGAMAMPSPVLATGGQRLAVACCLLALGAAVAVLPPLAALALVAGLGAVLLAAANPISAIAVAFVAIPLEYFVIDLGPVGVGPVQLTVILAVAIASAESVATRRIGAPRTPLDAWVFLWLAVSLMGAIGAHDPAATVKKAGMAVIFAAFFYLVTAKVRRTGTVTALMKVFVASSVVVGGYGIWVSLRFLVSGASAGNAIIVGSEGLAVPRAGSTLGQPTVLAALMVLALPIAMALVMETKGLERVVAAAAAAVVLVTLGFTFTRGAWLGGMVGLAVLALEKRMRVILVVMALAVLALSPEIVFERAASSTSVGRAEISHRFDFWNGALLVAEQRPLLGAGIDNFRNDYSRLPVPETALRAAIHPHNLALDLLAETGPAGLLAFGGMVAGALTLLLRGRRSDPDGARRLWRLAIAASLIGSLAHQTTDSLLLEPTWNMTMWTMLALAVVTGLRWTDGTPARGAGTEPAA